MTDQCYITDLNYINNLDDYVGVLLDSRLGNMMFQIAAGYAIARRSNKPFFAIIDEHKIQTSNSEFEYCKYFASTIFKKIKILTQFPKNCIVLQDNPPFNIFNPLPTNYKNLVYKGYFQSEKYFADVKSDILQLFEPPESVLTSIKKLYGDLSSFNAIHVRRGDYVNDLPRFDVVSANYINRCIDMIGVNDNYIVVSDDIEWCKTNLKIKNVIFADKRLEVDINKSFYTLMDLYIQTLCKNNITSNSTFSWWGAWLNQIPNSRVLIPTPWFAKNYFLNNYTKDLYPANWMQIQKY